MLTPLTVPLVFSSTELVIVPSFIPKIPPVPLSPVSGFVPFTIPSLTRCMLSMTPSLTPKIPPAPPLSAVTMPPFLIVVNSPLVSVPLIAATFLPATPPTKFNPVTDPLLLLPFNVPLFKPTIPPT